MGKPRWEEPQKREAQTFIFTFWSGRRTVSRLAHKDAALVGWRVGDVIVAVNGKPVKDNEAVKAAVAEALDEHSAGKPMKFQVRRLKTPIDRSRSMLRMTPGTGGELTMTMIDLTQSLLGTFQVVLFMEGTLKAPNSNLSALAVKALMETGLAFKAIDCDDEKYNPGVKAAVEDTSRSELTGQRLPQLFAGGRRVANGQEIQEMDTSSLTEKLFGHDHGGFLEIALESNPWRRMACVIGGGLIGSAAWFWLRGRPTYLVTVEESLKGARMPPVATVMNAMVQDIVVALGGSFGREAAPREIAAMWGGWVGDAFRVSMEQRKILVACGAGAGLAAVYSVPISGALYTIEHVLNWDVSFAAVVPAITTSVVATLVTSTTVETHGLYSMPRFSYGWPTWDVCLWALLVGPIAGLGAACFRRFIKFVEGYKPLGRVQVDFQSVKEGDEVWLSRNDKDGFICRVKFRIVRVENSADGIARVKVRTTAADEEYGEEEDMTEEDWDEEHAEGQRDWTIFVFMPLAFLVLALLSRTYPSLLGNGRALAEIAMQRQRSTPFLGMLLLLKALMTAAAIGSGAAGGTLTPAVALGATLGAILGESYQQYVPDWAPAEDQDSQMSVVAAAAFLAVAMNSDNHLPALLWAMTRSKGSQKTSIKLGARIDKDVKTDRQSTTLDFKSAAAMPEFNLVDPLAHVTGKKAATTSGMKTIFAAESSLNVNRRIRNAAVPLGCAVEDDAAVVEELTLQGMDLERSRKLMPRRPAWSYEISSGRLHHREAQSFKQWLADVQDLIQARGGYPPAYETNLQVWRQLWRVLERCHVAVCVIDARHPLLHLPPALIFHVSRTLRKPLLVVLNKLDAVSEENAICWAEALKRIPGVAAVLGYSKEDLRHRNFGDLQLGKEALIDAGADF
eukprot:s187_g6.t2